LTFISKKKYSLTNILNLFNRRGQLLGSGNCAQTLSFRFEQIKTNSHCVVSGDLFIAIRGGRRDAHDFIVSVLGRGVSCVIVQDSKVLEKIKWASWILVKDTRQAWADLSAYLLDNPQDRLRFVGITGTNGKTSTAFMCSELLKYLRCPVLTIGTLGISDLNYHRSNVFTTPDPNILYPELLKAIHRGTQHVVMEVSSQAIKHKRCQPISFDVGIWTSFSRDHLDFHGSMEEYWECKWSFFTDLVHKDGAVFFHESIGHQDKYTLLDERSLFLYGQNLSGRMKHKFRDIWDYNLLKKSFSGWDIVIKNRRKIYRGRLPYVCHYLCDNFVAAFAASQIWMHEEISTDIWPFLPQVPGRFQVVSNLTKRPVPSVVIDYAHTPAALFALLKSARNYFKGKVFVLFGCGGDRDKGKRPEMGKIAEFYADMIILTDDNPRYESPTEIINDIQQGFSGKKEVMVFEDRREAILQAIRLASPEDVVIFAGKGHESYQDRKGERIPFSDFAIVQEALAFF